MSDSPLVSKHKAVYVTYVLLDQNKNVFEQSDLPIGYVQGSNKGLFLKVEQKLEGRGVGEQVEVSLNPAEGFGRRDPTLTFTDDIDNVPPQFRHIGARVQFQNDKGEVRDFFVSEIKDGRLTVDGNHPLAGQTITFKITIVEVRDATPEEIFSGEVDGGGAPPVLH